MMKKVIGSFSASLIALIAFASASLAQSVVGNWDLTINSPQGGRTSAAVFKQDGGNVSGVLKGEEGELPLKVTVAQSAVTIKFNVNFQGSEFPITLTGKLEGDTMKGDADFGGLAQGDWSAKRTGGAASATSAPATAAPASGAAAGALGGDWDVTFSTPQGDVTAKITVTQEGTKISGVVKGQEPIGSVPLSGTANGEAFEMKYTIKFDGNDMTITMKGKLAGGQISGSADYGGLAEGDFKGKKN